MKNLNDDFISPLNDFVFAQIFGDQRNIGNTRAFLKTLLDIPEDDYDKLTVENPALKRFFRKDKMAMVDLRLTTKSGRIIHIELQVENRANLRNRFLYYLTRLVSEQIKWGDDYKKLHQVISIVICDHKLLEEEESYINIYELQNKKGRPFTNLMKLVILELPKLPKEKDSSVWPWLQFFKCKDKEDYKMLARRHPELKEAVFCARKMSLSERWRNYWFHVNLWNADERMLKEQIRLDGRTEAQLEIARKMKAMGDSVEKIHAMTDLPIETIEQL